jgi:hypothetical protein
MSAFVTKFGTDKTLYIIYQRFCKVEQGLR